MTSSTTANPYLRTKVLTASPEQLRLMLLEGALKFCRQGHRALAAKDYEGMYNALSRAQKIVLELSNGLKRDVNAELCDQLAALYTYLYRRLVDANMERDLSAIDETITLLDYERETWVLAMKKLSEERNEGAAPSEGTADHEETNPIATIGPRDQSPTPQPAPIAPMPRSNPFAQPGTATAGSRSFTA